MAKLKDLSIGTKDLFKIALKDLTAPSAWNARHDTPELAAHVRGLADSILEVGQQSPLTVFKTADDEIMVSDGFCRFAAFHTLVVEGKLPEDTPVLCLPEANPDETTRTLALLVRNSGKPLTAQEQSEVVARLEKLGMTRAEIARKSGITAVYVAKLATFAALPDAIKEKVTAGKITVSDAVEASKKGMDPEELKESKKREDKRRKPDPEGEGLHGSDRTTLASQEGELKVPKWAGRPAVTIGAVGLLRRFADQGYSEALGNEIAEFLMKVGE